MKREAIFVAGLACDTANMPLFNRIKNIGNGRGWGLRGINGVKLIEDGPVVVTPSEQTQDLLQRIDLSSADELIVIGHCLGAIAVVNALVLAEGMMNGLVISPPILNPFNVIIRSNLNKKYIEQEQVKIPSLTYPEGVIIAPDYFDELTASCDRFATDLCSLDLAGEVRTILPTNDWNKDAMVAAQVLELATVQYVESTHSLSSATDDQIASLLFEHG